ncbi:hypothetical protein GUITHDRAFT_122767 [Guillardia theta CCMP2712]|uniref:B box-type domain-containing protein n=1 Tax=Guillardia theta (strain CCMP2712) TaxID=905079 RepID=L1I562_GUITC|nr:hypothetical protein GUITHDRAFT_122767 [Guillardia theta CCMP2712]EKX31029.1 hypothetical protein GUITHDRAFT_122767 [Guillardia theta CCMP2712]|eukprot:XP_005818009.1 hypothetical protein GUITHDRAFT_122767 [Guillardia theta CCMP2712]
MAMGRQPSYCGACGEEEELFCDQCEVGLCTECDILVHACSPYDQHERRPVRLDRLDNASLNIVNDSDSLSRIQVDGETCIDGQGSNLSQQHDRSQAPMASNSGETETERLLQEIHKKIGMLKPIEMRTTSDEILGLSSRDLRMEADNARRHCRKMIECLTEIRAKVERALQ